jgi:hypothetical protein
VVRHGYANVLAQTFDPNVGPWRVQPLIVTTADLLIYRPALQTADLSTGDLTSADYDRVTWLWLDQNLSRSLMPTVRRRLPTPDPTVGDHVLQWHRRAVAICRPEGLQSALSAIALQDLHPLR